MEDFKLFFEQGWLHISDITAYDHILFITALTAIYSLRRWGVIAWLVTAFTVGHSLALAASVLQWVSVPTALVEFLIPITILLTCGLNIATAQNDEDAPVKNLSLKYGAAVFFGLIHGLGFSNYLKFILSEQDSLFMPLLGFNVGLEFGQLLIMQAILLLNFIFVRLLKSPLRDWTLITSAAVAGIALVLSIETGYAFFVGE